MIMIGSSFHSKSSGIHSKTVIRKLVWQWILLWAWISTLWLDEVMTFQKKVLIFWDWSSRADFVNTMLTSRMWSSASKNHKEDETNSPPFSSPPMNRDSASIRINANAFILKPLLASNDWSLHIFFGTTMSWVEMLLDNNYKNVWNFIEIYISITDNVSGNFFTLPKVSWIN